MDKNKLLGFLFLAMALVVLNTQKPPPKNPQPQPHESPRPAPNAISPTGGTSAKGVVTASNGGEKLIESAPQRPTEKTYKLIVEGEYVVTFTSYGGAIKEVLFINPARRFRKVDPARIRKLDREQVRQILGELHKANTSNNEAHKWEQKAKRAKIPLQWIAKARTKESFNPDKLFEEPNDYILNEGQSRPILDLDFDALNGEAIVFSKIEQDDNSITFQAQHGDIVITRIYELVEGSFRLNHTTTVKNTGTTNKDLGPHLFYGMGASLPTTSDKHHEFQNVGYFDGKRGFTGRRKPQKLKFQKMVKGDIIPEPTTGIHWATVRNQFFAVTLAPQQPTSGIVKGQVFDLDSLDHQGEREHGVRGQFGLKNAEALKPGQSLSHKFSVYAGPKEYKRLTKAGKHQDLVMQFGFFGIFSKLLLLLMQTLHGFVHNWGLAIILMTILIKLLFWPLTAKASESQKRMQKIQGPMKELQAKHKDNPQKMQQEVSKLFRENKVNPLAGCMPILIQMPIFLGLFFMLRSAAELRFAEFLWIKDLSESEQLVYWGVNIPLLGEYFNVLPILMGLTMFFQMRMTPMPTGNDPQQQMQAKMFRFLPFIFLFMLYSFSSGLVLYWTVQNVLTIVQQTITNKKKDSDPVVLPETSERKKNKKKRK